MCEEMKNHSFIPPLYSLKHVLHFNEVIETTVHPLITTVHIYINKHLYE